MNETKATFPLVDGKRTIESLGELVAYVKHRVKHGVVDNPGQSTSSDHFSSWRASDSTKNVRRALGEAAAILVARADDPFLLGEYVSIGNYSGVREFHLTLLDRLGSGQLPGDQNTVSALRG